MGNQNSNDDFTRNPNFNINQHQEAMRNLQANYTESGYSFNAGPTNNVKVTETQFKSIHRTASIYKSSIDIHTNGGNMKIKFQYDSDNGSKLEIYIGVEKVEQNPESKITNNIKSEILFEEMLGAGQKSKFEKEYSVNTLRQINGCNIILRIMSLNSDERTQYSVKNVGSNNWKILLQKLEIKGYVTQLHNIYKGGNENDECIICFCEKVNTLIEPCNHLCLCYDCCDHVKKSSNTCPICRTHIKAFKKIKSSE